MSNIGFFRVKTDSQPDTGNPENQFYFIKVHRCSHKFFVLPPDDTNLGGSSFEIGATKCNFGNQPFP
jgi:hypothetical protein